MASELNGRPAESYKASGRANERLVRRQISASKVSRPTSLSSQAFGWVTRLAIWYTIFVALFRCPSSIEELSEQSSQICKPYLNARSYIAPYIQPHYDNYVAPHLERVRPYYDQAHSQVLAPATAYGQHYYESYGAPRVEQARKLGSDTWERRVRPQVESVQTEAKKQYDSNVAPHMDRASAATEPYLRTARDNANHIYSKHMIPTYQSIYPYLNNAYTFAYLTATETAFPHIRSAWSTSVVFLDRTLWPRLRILYGENVEPQLVRIGERLGRYRDGKKMQAIMDETDEISSAASTASSMISSVSSSTASVIIQESAKPQETLKPEEEGEQMRKKIEDDLQAWQEKFARAAETGIEDLEGRVNDITHGQITRQVGGTGVALIVRLEETVHSEEVRLQRKIVSLVSALPEEISDSTMATAIEQLAKATRSAGVAVKEDAQAIRSWRQNYDTETAALVSAAVNSTLEVIDNIRDLGLQEIGMKWAHMEGVTYKDWSKYHGVKKSSDEWHQRAESVAVDHGGLQAAHRAGEELEIRGMNAAEEAAKELSRLKDVGKWKIEARDGTDDFSTRKTPPVAAKAAQKVGEKLAEVSEKIVGSSTGTLESFASVASEQAASAASSASSIVIGTEPGVGEQASLKLAEAAANGKASILGTPQPKIESFASIASESAASLVSTGSEAVIGTETPLYQSMASKASDNLDSAATAISSAIRGTETPISESVASQASKISSSASSAGKQYSKKVYGGAMAQEVRAQQPIMDDLDDDSRTYSEKMKDIVEDTKDLYADASKAVSEAILGASKTQGTVESATSVAGEQYSMALSAASSVLYGTQTGTVESATSLAAEKWAQAVAAASSKLYGTPTPVVQSMGDAALSAYAEATRRASVHYDHAISNINSMITGTPKPVHAEMSTSVQSAYTAALSAASSRLSDAHNAASTALYGDATHQIMSAVDQRYSSALAAASTQLDAAKSAIGATSTPGYEKFMSDASSRYSSLAYAASTQRASASNVIREAIYGPEQGVLQSISSVASSRLADGLGAASAQYESARSAFGATPTPASQKVLDDSKRRYYEAVGMAHDRYSEFFTSASQAVYGTTTPAYQSLASAASTAIIGSETPWTESVVSQASQNWEAIVSKASEQVYGSSMPFHESAYSQAGEYAAQATQAAAANYEAVQAVFADLVKGREPDFTESVMGRLSSAYYKGAHVSIASSASSYASDAYATVTSVVSSVFTAPPTVEAIIAAANAQVSAALDAASVQVYGTEKGTIEKGTSAVGSAASSASSRISQAVYGTEAAYIELAQSSLAAIASSASDAIAVAMYGSTATGISASATSVAIAASSVVGDKVQQGRDAVEATRQKIREAVYGPEQGAVESAQAKLQEAIEAAKTKMAGWADGAGRTVDQVQVAVGEGVGSVSSKLAEVTAGGKTKDEL